MPAKAAKKKNLSALKRVREAEKRNLRNNAIRSKIKSISKKVEEAVAEKNQDILKQLLKDAAKVIQSAASKGILQKNTASRKISRLSKLAGTVFKASAA